MFRTFNACHAGLSNASAFAGRLGNLSKDTTENSPLRLKSSATIFANPSLSPENGTTASGIAAVTPFVMFKSNKENAGVANKQYKMNNPFFNIKQHPLA